MMDMALRRHSRMACSTKRGTALTERVFPVHFQKEKRRKKGPEKVATRSKPINNYSTVQNGMKNGRERAKSTGYVSEKNQDKVQFDESQEEAHLTSQQTNKQTRSKKPKKVLDTRQLQTRDKTLGVLQEYDKYKVRIRIESGQGLV